MHIYSISISYAPHIDVFFSSSRRLLYICPSPDSPSPFPLPNPTGQETFVSGSGSPLELIKFEVFMGNNSARLQWPYSNPNYTLVR